MCAEDLCGPRQPDQRLPQGWFLLVITHQQVATQLQSGRACHCSQTPKGGERKHRRWTPRLRACRYRPPSSAQRKPTKPPCQIHFHRLLTAR